jgi:hypothetical protein
MTNFLTSQWKDSCSTSYKLINPRNRWTIRFGREGGWANTQKNSSRTLTKEKISCTRKLQGEKIVQKPQGFRTVGDILYVFHTKIVGRAYQRNSGARGRFLFRGPYFSQNVGEWGGRGLV